MDCRKFEQLIILYHDGELSRYEAEAVKAHLEVCAACGSKYADSLQISGALHDLGKEVVTAPQGFSAAVMQKIADDEKAGVSPPRISWINRYRKPAMAGIAAALILMVGSFFANTPPLTQIADNPLSLIQPDKSPVGTDLPTNNNNSPDTDTHTNPNSGTNPAQPGITTPNQNTDENPEPNNHDEPLVVAQPPDGNVPDPMPQPMVLLNKDRALTTTLLQVETADSSAALQKAIGMAGAVQARTQNLGQQVNEKGSFTVLKITVPKSSANGLLSQLSSLGTVNNKEITKNDISSQYHSKFSQYQSLINQRSGAADKEEAAALDKRIQSMENELRNWDQQADQETVILWLAK